jgi:lipoprotein-anchoring transpeptidase ErfK/SrfK
MSPRTFARKTGWVKVSGKYYYFGKTGVQVTGFLQMPKYTYYLDPKQGGARKLSSWVVVNKKCYYVDAKGRVQKGFVTVGKKTYYMNSDGVRQKGLVTVNGKIYYMDRSTAAMRTGWVTYSGRTYYFQKTAARKGQAIVGWLKKDGAKYYFGSNGAMQTGWLTIGTQKYYLDPTTGKMTTGKRTIDGKTYDFGTKGYITIEPTGAWLIKVNQGTNVVTIYRGDTAVKALTCSVGLNGATPNGTFYIRDKLRWHELMGPSWGQYCSHITDDILFHSVPCNSYQDNRSMSASAYNKLGQAASHGCIRLNVASAKWIYDNCPIGTKVIVFTGTSADDPLGKPYIAKIPSTQTWDPTDPNL